MSRGDEVYYLSGDHLGSTSLTTDDTGTIISEVRYLPYGQERWNNGASVTDFGFTAQRSEKSFGLMDYNARYYSPLLGRFISPDSIVPDPTSSSGFNRYRYAKNNPLLYVDPSGHQGCSVFNDLCYNFDPWKPLRDMWDSAPESAPKAVEDLATNAVEEINASGKLAGNAAERLVPPAPDAITVGGSVSANLGVPGFSIDMGGEVVINFNSGEVTGFSYNGPGAAYGASAILTGYGGMVWNLPDNSAYSGPFESVNITAAGGEGGSFTYFWAPGDEPVIGAFTPNNAKGISFGYGYGAGGSVSYNQTEYTELFELNLQKDSPEEEIIPPEWEKDEWGR